MDIESQYFKPFLLGLIVTLAILIANVRARQ
jgi:hypothetical protein